MFVILSVRGLYSSITFHNRFAVELVDILALQERNFQRRNKSQ